MTTTASHCLHRTYEQAVTHGVSASPRHANGVAGDIAADITSPGGCRRHFRRGKNLVEHRLIERVEALRSGPGAFG